PSQGPSLAADRSVPRRTGSRSRRVNYATRRILLWRDRRRNLEDHGRRRDLGAGFGWTVGDRIRRRDRGFGIRAERDLRRHGRGVHSRKRVSWRWGLQVDRRRQDVEECWPQRDPAHWSDPHPSEEPGCGLRRGAGSSVRTESGARRIPHDRWRQDLEAGSESRAEGGRGGPVDGRDQFERALRGVLGSVSDTIFTRERRPGKRHLEVDGRWGYVVRFDARAGVTARHTRAD